MANETLMSNTLGVDALKMTINKPVRLLNETMYDSQDMQVES